MNYDLALTPQQVQAIAGWVVAGAEMAPVQLTTLGDNRLYAAQGDMRAGVEATGRLAPAEERVA